MGQELGLKSHRVRKVKVRVGSMHHRFVGLITDKKKIKIRTQFDTKNKDHTFCNIFNACIHMLINFYTSEIPSMDINPSPPPPPVSKAIRTIPKIKIPISIETTITIKRNIIKIKKKYKSTNR